MEQTANLIWDADRSWWLTTDIDLNSSYIGGGEPLIEALLRSDKLETWPVASEDGRFDPDPFNPAPPDPPPTERFPPSWLPLWRRLWLEFRIGLPKFRFHSASAARGHVVFRPRKNRDIKER